MDFKSLEEAKRKVGGAFRLSVLLQKRIIELVRGGQPPTVESAERERSPIDVALREIVEDKISLEAIDPEEFEGMVEEARIAKEGMAAARGDEDTRVAPPTAMPTIDLPSDPLSSSE